MGKTGRADVQALPHASRALLRPSRKIEMLKSLLKSQMLGFLKSRRQEVKKLDDLTGPPNANAQEVKDPRSQNPDFLDSQPLDFLTSWICSRSQEVKISRSWTV
jgi:hypothetical protein